MNSSRIINQNKKIINGFTLIELLVVISIIALLLSILMPSLRKARDQAKDVVCKSNIKAQGLVFQTYTADNNGYFPTHINKSPIFVKDEYHKTLLDRNNGIKGSDMTKLLNGYIGDAKVFYCPLTQRYQYMPTGPDWSYMAHLDVSSGVLYNGWNNIDGDTARYIAISYGWWLNLVPPGLINPSAIGSIKYFGNNKLVKQAMQVSSQMGLVSDMIIIRGVYDEIDGRAYTFSKDKQWPPQWLPHPWQVGGINVLYGDFHVGKTKWHELSPQILTYGSGGAGMHYW